MFFCVLYAPAVGWSGLCNLTLQFFLFTAYKAKKNKIVIAHPKGGKMQRFGPLITDSIVCFWFPCFLKGWRKIAVPNSLPLPPPWGLQNLFLVVDRVLWVCGFIIRPCKNPW